MSGAMIFTATIALWMYTSAGCANDFRKTNIRSRSQPSVDSDIVSREPHEKPKTETDRLCVVSPCHHLCRQYDHGRLFRDQIRLSNHDLAASSFAGSNYQYTAGLGADRYLDRGGRESCAF